MNRPPYDPKSESPAPVRGFPLFEPPLRVGGRWLVHRFGHALPLDLTEAEAAAWAEARGHAPDFARARARAFDPEPFAGLVRSDRPLVMGIVNVTPDSFSDGGRFFDPETAVAHGLRLIEAGADLLDVGGESTRPGAVAVDENAEAARVVPVIAALKGCGVPISVDTRRANVMAAALAAGAVIVNDVTALAGDPRSLSVVAEHRCPLVLMHMRGEPRTMQDAPAYDDVVSAVHGFLARAVERAEGAGIPLDQIAVDPGIGFGKTATHNAELLARTALFRGLAGPVLVGVSRKSMVAHLSKGEPADARLPGSLAAALAATARGADILRVHDVAETVQALSVWGAIGRADPALEPSGTSV